MATGDPFYCLLHRRWLPCLACVRAEFKRSEMRDVADIMAQQAGLGRAHTFEAVDPASQCPICGVEATWHDPLTARRTAMALREALEVIAEDDDLVTASGGAWGQQAYERRRDIARVALASEATPWSRERRKEG